MRTASILFSLLFIYINAYDQDFHPHILVKPQHKPAILQKIKQQAWAKAAFDKMVKDLSPYVSRHKTDPEWILSRYLMNRVPGKRYTQFFADKDGNSLIRWAGDAPYPTIRISSHKRPPITAAGSTYMVPAIEELVPYDTSMKMMLKRNEPGEKEDWVNPQTFVEIINGKINQLALDASILFWLTGNEDYAMFAADILSQWARGAAYQQPIEGPCKTGFLSIQTLGDGRYEPMPLAYDFLYDFLRSKKYETSYYETVFEKIAHTMTFRGYWNNNCFAEQATAMIFSVLSLEDKKRRSFYLDFYLNRDTINGECGHLAMPSVVSKWLTPDGHWKEPGGYHNSPVSSLLISALALENNGYAVFNKYPALFQASYVMLKYSFPNYIASSFGDSGSTSQSPECLEVGIVMAKKYNNKILDQLMAAMNVLIKNKQYKRESGAYLGLLTYLPEIPAAAGASYQWPRSGELDFAKAYLQRNGTDPENGLMYFVQGATYNHNHANGMSVELYGAGHIMGIDPGKGVTYETPMHINYYAQWAAHNTVVAGGKSSSVPYFKGGGGTKKMGGIRLAAMEPKPGVPPVSPFTSFTDTRYTDISTNTEQQRSLSIIRTSDSSGYYVDIYRSANPQSNEYIYHNIGNELSLLNSERKPVRVKAAKFPLHKKPFDPPGFRNIKNIRSTGRISDLVIALFTVKEERSEKFMQVIFPAVKGRTYYTGKGPNAANASWPFNAMLTPTLISRQEGEAWQRPFIAVYEPFTGKENYKVMSSEIFDQEDPGNFAAIKVTNKDESSQLIFQAVTQEKAYEKDEYRFKGNFGVVSVRKTIPEYLYLGEGSELSYNNYSVKINDSSGAVNLQIKPGRLKIDCTQETLVTIPAGTIKKITLVSASGEKNLVFLLNEETVSFTIPPVFGAEIIIRQ